MPKLYVVKMNRWGDRKNHSYIIALTYDALTASISGIHEKSYRGGKYYPEVLSFDVKSVKEDYYINEVYDDNRKNAEFMIIGEDVKTEGFVVEDLKYRKNKIIKCPVRDFISDEEMLELHENLYFYNFSNEELAYLRDRYESYIRRKI